MTETSFEKPSAECKASIRARESAMRSPELGAEADDSESSSVSSSPSFTISHESDFHGKERSSSGVSMGDGLKIDTVSPAVRWSRVDCRGISFCSRRWVYEDKSGWASVEGIWKFAPLCRTSSQD